MVSCAWERVRDYLEKAGTTIFLASLVLWFFLHLGPQGAAWDVSESFAAVLGRGLAPVLVPAGLGAWQTAVALLTGLSAKEVVVSSFFILYGAGNRGAGTGHEALAASLAAGGFTGASALALLVFCLLYTPCAAAMGAIKQETGSLRWTVGLAVYQLFLAWICAVLYTRQPAGSRGWDDGKISACMEAGGSEIDKERKTEWMKKLLLKGRLFWPERSCCSSGSRGIPVWKIPCSSCCGGPTVRSRWPVVLATGLFVTRLTRAESR